MRSALSNRSVPVRSGPYRIPPGSPRQREGLLVRSPLVIIAQAIVAAYSSISSAEVQSVLRALKPEEVIVLAGARQGTSVR